MIQLPIPYIDKMKSLLGEEDAARFLQSYGQPRTFGLRINPTKISSENPEFAMMQSQFGLAEIPWCPTGYYYDETARPGKHPYYAAGLYYIQEPSAMSSVEWLQPIPGDTVLDLAAAPGGKSTQIAGKLQGQGLLIANEIHPARARILSENMERFGAANVVVTSASPQQLAQKFPLFFDKIMLDAPCSGEGMFRKDPDSINEWSIDHVAMCAVRQLDILRQAAIMLKAGGKLVYSTCTFNREENECLIEAFVEENSEFRLLKTERIWPHEQRGEGHFVAVLHKTGDNLPIEAQQPFKPAARTKPLKDALELFSAFSADHIPSFAFSPGEPLLFGEQLYWLPADSDQRFHSLQLQGLKVLRPGLHLATLKKNRIEPAHSLALSLPASPAYLPSEHSLTFPHNSAEIQAYLHGDTITCPEHFRGWTVVHVDSHPIGWAKANDGQLKNHYPKGLRWLG